MNARDHAGLYELLLKDANIPRRYERDMSATCLIHDGWRAAFMKARDMLLGQRHGSLIIVCGPRGTGKTQLACELIRACAIHGNFFSRYEVFQDYLDSLPRAFNNGSHEEHQNRYLAPRLVVIDEIAKAGDAAWTEGKLFHLVNTRYNDLKHTVLITAAGPDQLNDVLSPSVADRTNEGGAIIHLNWPSFRSNP